MAGTSLSRTVRMGVLADVLEAKAKLEELSARIHELTDKPKVVKVVTESDQIGKQDLRAAENEAAAAGSQSGKAFKNAFNQVGMFAAGAVVAGLAESVKAALNLQQVQAQLSVAVNNSGGSWAKQKDAIEQNAQGFAKYGYSVGQAEAALTPLVRVSVNVTQAMNAEKTAADLAAAKHVSLATASDMLAKAAGGNARALKSLGIIQATGSTQASAMTSAQKILADQIQQAGGMAGFAAAHHISLAKATTLVAEASGIATHAQQQLAGVGLTATSAATLLAKAQAGDSSALKTLGKDNMTIAQLQRLTTDATYGNVGAFNKLGIEVLPKSATAAQKLAQTTDILNQKLGGSAAAASKTFKGQLDAAKASLDNVAESVGMKVLPYVTKFAGWLAKIAENKGVVTTILSIVAALAAAWAVWKVVNVAVAIFNALSDANPWVLAIMAIIAVVVLLATHWKSVCAFLKAAWRDVTHWIGDAWKVAVGVVKAIWHVVALYFTTEWKILVAIWHGVCDAFSAVWDAAVAVVRAIWNVLKGFFAFEWRGLQNAWHAVTSFFSGAWDAAVSVVKGVWNSLVGFGRTIFGALENIIMGPVKLIEKLIGYAGKIGGALSHIPGVSSVLHAFGFAGGGIVPGYAPGHDVVPALLSPGEAVLTPEATRAIGADNILALNAQSGRPAGGSATVIHAAGGYVPSLSLGAPGARPGPGSVQASGGGALTVEWVGGSGADQEFITWLKKNIRIRGGDPSVLGR